MAQVQLTPELIITISKNAGFQARLETQLYIHAKWIRENWHTPDTLHKQKALNYAHQLRNGFNGDRSVAVKLALAGYNDTVDDQYFEQNKLEARTVILFEDFANILPGDDQLSPE